MYPFIRDGSILVLEPIDIDRVRRPNSLSNRGKSNGCPSVSIKAEGKQPGSSDMPRRYFHETRSADSTGTGLGQGGSC